MIKALVAFTSIADRATISNMCPESGATVCFFPVDESSLTYLNQTGRTEKTVNHIRVFFEKAKMFRNYAYASTEPVYSKVYKLDLAKFVT